ncbi:putative short-chain dehydrogenase/reductase [Aspergillus undulatus]|uniref:putative short-chain dehydrogenase/reductase n=1 Tax=Aspergillus undulatus TaxID=1810928 RepID=UPI003CCD65B7
MSPSPYAAAHANPQGAGDARPTALQIIQDQNLTDQLTGKFIGKEALSDAGVLETGTGSVSLVEMDLASLHSVRKAASEILAASKGQGRHEMHFATNYLGHFLLFKLLKPALLGSASSTFNSRVVVVSSSAHRAGNIELAGIYMANEIDRRYGGRGLHATNLHPRAIDTNISRHVGRGFVDGLLSNPDVVRVVKSAEQGTATTVVAAVGKECEDRGGVHPEDCGEAKPGVDDGQTFGMGWVKRTYEERVEGWLWGMSSELIRDSAR